LTKTGYVNEALLSLIFPRRCPVCDKPVKPYGELICDECRQTVRYVSDPVCCKCGKQLYDDAAEYCDDCKRITHFYIRGMALFDYKSVSDSVYRFKYKGRREYAKWYGKEMCDRLGNKMIALKPDALIPVPIHSSKLKVRGYNQASLIAHELSDRLGIPVYDDVVCRIKKTTPLKDHTPSERNYILRGAFKLGRNDVKLKSIMIIDDIYTTGATVDSVAKLLTAGGADRIYYAALSIGKGI